MSWICPYDANGQCKKRRKKCEPMERGCILAEKVVSPEKKEGPLKKEG